MRFSLKRLLLFIVFVAATCAIAAREYHSEVWDELMQWTERDGWIEYHATPSQRLRLSLLWGLTVTVPATLVAWLFALAWKTVRRLP